MLGEISIVARLVYWGLISICPDPPWPPWPWPRPDPWPWPWPPPPPWPWRIISLVAGVASAFVITSVLGEVEGTSRLTDFVLSGVFAYVGSRAALSIGRTVDAARAGRGAPTVRG